MRGLDYRKGSSLVIAVGALGRWLRLIALLMAKSFGDRYRRTSWPVLIAIAEPLGVVFVFAGTQSLLAHAPPFGSSSVLFFATGILPFYLFFHVSWRLRSWDYFLRLPNSTDLDLVIAHTLDEVITKVVIIGIVAFSLWLWDVPNAIPIDPIQCIAALLIISVVGIGVGLVNAAISAFFFPWLYIYAVLVRAWMAFSGVLFVVDRMPPAIRDLAFYNPLAHAITFFRAGYYVNYPSKTLDMEFLLLSSAGIAFFGLVSIASTSRWRSIR